MKAAQPSTNGPAALCWGPRSYGAEERSCARDALCQGSRDFEAHWRSESETERMETVSKIASSGPKNRVFEGLIGGI